MNSAKLNDWLQVLGMFAVVDSLVFVGLQMKQTQEIALADSYNDRAALTVDAYAGVMGSPQWYSGLAKLYSGRREQLTAEEFIAVESDFTIQMTIYEQNQLQYESGFLTEEHWQKNLAEIECLMTEPFFRGLARQWIGRESFQLVLDEAIERGLGAEHSCWEYQPGEYWEFFNPVGH